MKGQKTPSRKRYAQCPKCDLYYAPAGLIGHMRFYHKMGIGKKKQSSTDETSKTLDWIYEMKKEKKLLQLLGLAEQDLKAGGPGLPKEVVDGVLQLLVMDYLFGHGIFKQK